jgi:nitrogen fixation protein NifB
MKAQPGYNEELREQTLKHPCYAGEAVHQYARLHLPVAPACNIQCRYCCRRFDCVNESRPGVTSEVLSPEQALARFEEVRARIPALSVVGIAGPGDALANWPATRATLEKIRAADPQIIFCLSTNGLMLPDYAADIVAAGVRHLTVTLNAVDPEIGSRLYRWVTYEGRVLTGLAAARTLLARQLAGLEILARYEVMVKVNIVMIKGLNDGHIPEIARRLRLLGVAVSNIMPLIPAPGSDLAHWPATSRREVEAMRAACREFLPQMTHCQQCRADAVGLLGHDQSHEFRACGGGCDESPAPLRRYRLAVTSRYGLAVDTHFGHSQNFLIYEGDGESFVKTGERATKKYCGGPDDCEPASLDRAEIVELLKDCQAVVTMRIGEPAREHLLKYGLAAIEDCGSVNEALARAGAILMKQEQSQPEARSAWAG